MADDPWKRFRQRVIDKKPRNLIGGDSGSATDRLTQKPAGAPGQPVDELGQWLKDLPTLLEQLGHLYNMYLAGVELRPPLEKRKLAVNLTSKIIQAGKNSPGMRFKCATAVTAAQTHFDRWDKQLRALEAGEFKRRLQKKKPA